MEDVNKTKTFSFVTYARFTLEERFYSNFSLTSYISHRKHAPQIKQTLYLANQTMRSKIEIHQISELSERNSFCSFQVQIIRNHLNGVSRW